MEERCEKDTPIAMIVTRKQATMLRPQMDRSSDCPKIVALSTTDLAMPMVHVHIIFAFRSPTPPLQILEEGLRKVVSHYREWAGRILVDEINGWGRYIELTDEGVECVEATADCSLEELMPFYPSQSLHALLPQVEGVNPPLLIQMTKLKCGGMTIGMAWSHFIADGKAFIFFLEEWTRCVKGLSPLCSSTYDRSQLTATTKSTKLYSEIQSSTSPTNSSSPPSVSQKRLHFTPAMLQKLKQNSTLTSTFAAITGHLWKCVTKARRLDPEMVTCAAIGIDGRGRLHPPLADSYQGNAIFAPLAISTAKDLLTNPISYAAGIIQTSLAQINDEYIRESILQMQKSAEIIQHRRSMTQVAYPNLVVTSWLRFPLYDIDFGWGAPAFVGNVPRGEEGFMVLLPSHERDASIDVALQLFSADLQALEEICYDI